MNYQFDCDEYVPISNEPKGKNKKQTRVTNAVKNPRKRFKTQADSPKIAGSEVTQMSSLDQDAMVEPDKNEDNDCDDDDDNNDDYDNDENDEEGSDAEDQYDSTHQ